MSVCSRALESPESFFLGSFAFSKELIFVDAAKPSLVKSIFVNIFLYHRYVSTMTMSMKTLCTRVYLPSAHMSHAVPVCSRVFENNKMEEACCPKNVQPGRNHGLIVATPVTIFGNRGCGALGKA
jgi:hypothetical protein